MINALPRVVLAPIFTLWFGLGIWSKVALGVTLVFFIVFFNVYQGVKEVSPTVLANARMLGMNDRQLMRHVYWPSALSWMFSSLHTSVGFAVVGAVVGEYLGSGGGARLSDPAGRGRVRRRRRVRRHVRAGRLRDRDRLAGHAGREPAAGVAAGCGGNPHLTRTRQPCTRQLLAACPMVRTNSSRESVMRKTIRNALAALGALALMSGAAAAQSKVTIAVGGAGCLCYLPTMLAEQLGEYKKAGVEVELVDFKGGSQSLTAVIGGSADVVSGYFDHCVNLAAKNQALEAFVVYDRYPGLDARGRAEADRQDQFGEGPQGQEGRRQRAGLLDRLLPEISAEQERRRSELGRRGRHWPRRHRGRGDGAGLGGRRRHARSGDHAAAGPQQGPENPERHADAEGHARRVRRRISGRRALHQERLDRRASEGDAGAHQRDPRHLEVDPFAHARRDHGQDAGESGRRRTRRSISRR